MSMMIRRMRMGWIFRHDGLCPSRRRRHHHHLLIVIQQEMIHRRHHSFWHRHLIMLLLRHSRRPCLQDRNIYRLGVLQCCLVNTLHRVDPSYFYPPRTGL